MNQRLTYIFLLVVTVAMAVSCSTKKNTASSRQWQAFVTRYNVYFNGEQAYIEGRKAQDKGLQEDYTTSLPVFGVGYEKQRSLGKSNFETAITKCEKAIQLHSIKKKPAMNGNKTRTPKQKAYYSRKEFNPFLKNAWLLMGKAQFQKGEFSEAASTFSYITRFYAPEPAVVAEARIWLARCYAELDWIYDAEEVVQRMERDTMPSRLRPERDLTLADFYIRQDKLPEALPYLQRACKHEKNYARKARLYYLLGQTYMELDRKAEAYLALKKCVAQSPAYAMTFHARILQTEALTTTSNARSMIRRLKRMARNDNNKDYLDQVYYAIGNIHMTQRDTVKAISAYETGRAKATQKGLETAVLLLRLGDLYWDMQRFEKAQPCYTEAIGLLDKTHDAYQELNRRSKVLDALVPPTIAIHLQDSLQWLASLDETQRNAAIDRVIDVLKKKEAEERKAKRDSIAKARKENGDNGDTGRTGNDRGNNKDKGAMPGAMPTGGSPDWYFYNAQLVMQGKQEFKKQWGNRKNEDDWRRSNRTVVANIDNDNDDDNDALRYDDDNGDPSTNSGQADNDSIKTDKVKKDKLSPEEDPHCREYYLAQIPFTPEQLAVSDSILRESLYEAAVIEQEQLENLPLAAKTFGRLEKRFPDFRQMDEATYHLFLLYGRWAEQERSAGHIAQADTYAAKAEEYRQRMRNFYPEHPMTSVICDPDFETNARYGRELEDSLYSYTYNAYRAGDRETVSRNYETSTQKFPTGANRPKFIFVHALSLIGNVPNDSIIAELRTLTKDFPKSDVAEMAGMIVNGLEAGRSIASGPFDLGSLWQRRTDNTAAENAAVGEERALTPDRDIPFVFLVAYETGEAAADDRLLYELARFNFTAYVSRSFDIAKERDATLTQFRVSGFRNFDDAHGYVQRVFRDPSLAEQLREKRIEIISEKNLQKLGSLYSFEDYRTFYDSCFAPLDINPELPLEFEPEDEDVEYDETLPEDEVIYKPKVNDNVNDDDNDDDTLRYDNDALRDDDGKAEVREDTEVNEESEEEYILDDEEYILDEEEAPVKKTTNKDDDDIILDGGTTTTPPLNNDDEEYYDE